MVAGDALPQPLRERARSLTDRGYLECALEGETIAVAAYGKSC